MGGLGAALWPSHPQENTMSRRRVRSSLPRSRFGRVLSYSAALVLGAGLVVSCGAGGTGGNTGAGGDGGAYVGPTGNKCAADCSSDAAAPFCDPASGQCVQCLPEDDTCADGQYCDSASKACVAGCGGDEDCAAPLVCNMAIHACSACATDEQCAAGSICGRRASVRPAARRRSPARLAPAAGARVPIWRSIHSIAAPATRPAARSPTRT